MVKDWKNQIIEQWEIGTNWDPKEEKELKFLLNSICVYNNGEIYNDQKLSETQTNQYKIQRVNQILDSFVAEIFHSYFVKNLEQSYPIKSTQFKTPFSFIRPMKHTPKININSATFNELEKLPGLGKKTAERVIEYRQKNNRIKRLTELKKIKGLDIEDIRKFSRMVTLLDPSKIPVNINNTENLITSPSFSNFVAFMNTNNTLLTKFSKNPNSLKELIIQEIKGIANQLEIEPNLHGFSPGTRSSKVKKLFAEKKSLERFVKENEDKNLHGVLLKDSDYRKFTLKLLKEAQQKIRLVMFFFTFKDEESHATDKHMEEIINAKNRGVDIKIILDHQEEGDVKPTGAANKNAYEYLQKNKIPVTFESEEIPTHTKVLLVDDSHIVLGSHNWTAGSFYVYRDTSLYFNSTKLSSIYHSHFDSLWEEFYPTRKKHGKPQK